MPVFRFDLIRPVVWVGAALLASHLPTGASERTASQTELLSGAQMWAAKNRPDLARQLIEKLLLADRFSPIGLATLGELALRENETEEAQRLLDLLRQKHPRNRYTKELETLVRVYGPEREKLAEMRLMARAGRMAEAAQIAQTLFPTGPPTVGNLALEYFQMVGTQPNAGPKAAREMDQLYAQTGEPRYQIASLEMKISQGARPASLIADIETLANQPGVPVQTLQPMWRRAIDGLGNSAGSLRAVQIYLRRFPDDSSMLERLAAVQQAQVSTAIRARNPANFARKSSGKQEEAAEPPVDRQSALRELREREADILGEQGLGDLREGRHAQAQALFEQAYALSSERKWLDLQATARFWGLLRQADAALENKEASRAERLAREALALQPNNAEALTTLASIRVAQNASADAQALYEQALRQEPDNSSALKGLALLHARAGEPEKGLAMLAHAISTQPTLAGKLDGVRADILQERAQSLLDVQRDDDAARALAEAVVLVPDDAWMRHRLARIYIRLKQPDQALKVMDDGVALTPQAQQMRYARALIRSALDDYAGALSDVDQIAVAERSAGMKELAQRAAVQQLVQQAAASARPEDTKALLEQAEKRALNDSSLLYSVANAWFKRGQALLGLAVFDRLETRSANVPTDVQLDYAGLLNRAGDDSALTERLPRLLAIDSWNDAQQAQLLSLYGDHMERQIERQREAGHMQQAERLAQAPLPIVGASAATVPKRRVQAQLLTAAGKYRDATELLSGLVIELPQDSALRMALGDALARQGRKEEAAVQARWLEQHLPAGDIGLQLALLRLWQRADETVAAHALSERLLQAAPTDTDVVLHAARLERSQRDYAKALALFQKARALEQGAASTPAPVADPLTVAVITPVPAPVTPAAATPGAAAQVEANDAQTTRRARGDAAPANPSTTSVNADSAVLTKIDSDIRSIEARRQAWVEGGQQAIYKNSTDGISSLHGWERPLVAYMPTGYDGHYFLHVDQVHLNAGKLPDNAADALGYGQVAASPRSEYRKGGESQRASATNVGFGFVGDQVSWDIGATGIGFPVTNWVGGVSHSGSTDRFNYKFELSRRPLTGSLLSYSGAYDPITGNVWGGVVATGVSARVATDFGAYSTSLSASYALLSGKNVVNNTRLQLRWAADRDVWASRNSTVNVGMALSAWRYQRDLSEYSWGHGGYYSPHNYLSIALPVEWSGRKGAWTWLARASVSLSRSSSGASDIFPGDSTLQNRLAALGGQPQYAAGGSTGFGRSFRGALEYDVSPNLTLGGQLYIDRSAFYAPTNLLLYARFWLDPVLVSPANRPRPVQTYSSY